MVTLPGASPVPTAVPPSTRTGGLTYRGLLFQILSQKPDASPDEIVTKLDQLAPQMTPQDRLEWQKHRQRLAPAQVLNPSPVAGERVQPALPPKQKVSYRYYDPATGMLSDEPDS